MKVLFTASIEEHLRGFHIPYIQYFKEKGFETHTAAKGENTILFVDRHFDIPFDRSPLSLNNILCYRALKRIIEQNRYDIIHCHTPVVSVLTRLAARKSRKKGTVVIYTAHGFHFYKGAPRLHAIIYRLVEKSLSRYTDCLITINSEDFSAVTRYGFKPKSCYMVHGVGVDSSRFTVQTKEVKNFVREKCGISQKTFVLIFAAEYSRRKNQSMLIETVCLLKKSIPDVLLLLPGEGSGRSVYEKMINTRGLKDNIRLMGYRSDMDFLLQAADVVVSSAVQEGLPINIVEAMAVSLPVIATRIRGHIDLIKDNINGYLVDAGDAGAMAERLLYLYEHPDIAESMGKAGSGIVKPYLLGNVKEEMIEIYESLFKKQEPGQAER